MKEWQKYKVGKPSTKSNWTEPDCCPLSTVSHTSHVAAAINIVSSNEIQPSLVYDKSRLNTQRILVSWLSPNHWSGGFRYGNVRFTFDFRKLIAEKRFYWVETIDYAVPACRILITDVDRSAVLPEYNPANPDGPWWHDKKSDTHYYNGNICLELMVESSVSLNALKELDFVRHHEDMCSLNRTNPKACSEVGFHEGLGGAYFLCRAGAVGTNLSNFAKSFVRDDGKPSPALKNSLSEFAYLVTHEVKFSGQIEYGSDESAAQMRAIFSAFAFGHDAETAVLASRFSSRKDFELAAANLMASVVGYKDWEKLVPIK